MKKNRDRFLVFVQTALIVHFARKEGDGAFHIHAAIKLDEALHVFERMPEDFDPMQAAVGFLRLNLGSAREQEDVRRDPALRWMFIDG